MEPWADMLSRIGQKNSRLYEIVAREFSARDAVPGPAKTKGRILEELQRERSRIARDLHAGAGQPLAGIKMNLETLDDCARYLPAPGQAALSRLQILTEQALQQVRAVSHSLHPPDWQGLTTEEALRLLVQTSGLEGRLTIELGIQPLPEEPALAVKIAIYRCAQECLSNVSRHSEASRLWISLRPDRDMVELHLRDDGRGFSPDQADGSGIGLRAIREHALALDGTCEISGLSGVEIVIRLPLDPD